MSGSFASEVRCAVVSCWAPVCQASPSETTWSICTSADVVTPRTKWMMPFVYGETSVPDITRHAPERAMPARSRASTSLRVSHPLRSTSSQAAPKSAVRL
ncbi:hypothetical protein [Pseudolysinimonas kribbensis]|uniref:hypothetical protein n=1 Tax=Pseudolysinimonas kribbensis TaxID=433641 RepID=UPI0024E08AEA|nr:hypothetical protein [Pseudolysinimonas kribbensis]